VTGGTLAEEGLTGFWYFIGDYILDLKSGKGGSRARPALFVIEESALGTGYFECVATAKIEGFTGLEYIQYGNFAGCHGFVDFEGMRMKGYLSNEANPGTDIYDMWGEVW
jgi:hypothetical protein